MYLKTFTYENNNIIKIQKINNNNYKIKNTDEANLNYKICNIGDVLTFLIVFPDIYQQELTFDKNYKNNLESDIKFKIKIL